MPREGYLDPLDVQQTYDELLRLRIEQGTLADSGVYADMVGGLCLIDPARTFTVNSTQEDLKDTREFMGLPNEEAAERAATLDGRTPISVDALAVRSTMDLVTNLQNLGEGSDAEHLRSKGIPTISLVNRLYFNAASYIANDIFDLLVSNAGEDYSLSEIISPPNFHETVRGLGAPDDFKSKTGLDPKDLEIAYGSVFLSLIDLIDAHAQSGGTSLVSWVDNYQVSCDPEAGTMRLDREDPVTGELTTRVTDKTYPFGPAGWATEQVSGELTATAEFFPPRLTSLEVTEPTESDEFRNMLRELLGSPTHDPQGVGAEICKMTLALEGQRVNRPSTLTGFLLDEFAARATAHTLLEDQPEFREWLGLEFTPTAEKLDQAIEMLTHYTNMIAVSDHLTIERRINYLRRAQNIRDSINQLRY